MQHHQSIVGRARSSKFYPHQARSDQAGYPRWQNRLVLGYTFLRSWPESIRSQCAWFAGICLLLLQPELIAWFSPAHVSLGVGCAVVATCARQYWPLILFLAWSFANTAFISHRDSILPSELERQDIIVSGSVVGLPKADWSRTRFDFLIDQASLREEPDRSLGNLSGVQVRLSCYRCQVQISAGDRWAWTIRVKRPNGYASWGVYDYEKSLFRHQITATGYLRSKEAMTLLNQNVHSVHRWRSSLRDKIEAVSKSRQAQSAQGLGILAALAIGDRSHLELDAQEVLRSTGVSHLIAISGLHVGLVFLLASRVIALIMWPAARLYEIVPRQTICLPIALIVAFSYAALAGFAISTQRAIVMLSIYVVCRCLARELPLVQILLLAVCVLLLFDPFSILDAGFWLSCYAVLVIAVLNHRHTELSLWKLQPWLWLGMLPLTSLLFGQISLVSPAVNLVVVPLFCIFLIPATLLAMVAMLLGFESVAAWSMGQLMAVMQWGFNQLRWVSSLDIAQIYPPETPLWLALTLASLLLLSIKFLQVLPVFLVAACLSFAPIGTQLGPDEYQVTLLDVGQGLSVVIQSRDHVLLYDTGPRYPSGFSAAQAVVLPYLRQTGVRRIDHLVISHADNDHIGGLNDILEGIPVSKISTSRRDKMPPQSDVVSRACQAGQKWQMNQLQFSFLGPDANTPQGSNNRSCVLKLSNGSISLLLTGDIEKQVERYMLRSSLDDLRADILLVPHQGSKTSSTTEFLDQVDPQLALVAAGYKNHYGHPHSDVLARYAEAQVDVLSTIVNGSVRITVAGDKITTERYRGDNPRFWRRRLG